MAYLFNNIRKNIRDISPKHLAIMKDEGWCFAFAALQRQAEWGGKEAIMQYENRLLQLGQDLTHHPIEYNGKKYYRFSEVMDDFEILRTKKNPSPEEKLFIKQIFDTLAFIEAMTLTQSPRRIKFLDFVKQDADKSFLLTSSKLLEKSAKTKPLSTLSIYHHPLRISLYNRELLPNLLDTIDKITPPDAGVNIACETTTHAISFTRLNGKWEIFDQNTISDTKGEFYVKLTPENVIDAFSIPAKLNNVLIDLNVYVSPKTVSQAEAHVLQQKLENSTAHKNLATNFTTDWKIPDSKNLKPLFFALAHGHVELTKELLEKEPSLEPYTGLWALVPLAAYSNDTDLVKYLVKDKGLHPSEMLGDRFALYYAARYGNLEMAKFLIDQKSSPSQPTAKNNIPLHAAASQGHLEMVKFLVDASKTANPRNIYGVTPVFKAAKAGHFDVVKYLLDHGAKSDLKDTSNNNLLHYAALGNNLDLLKHVVTLKLDINSVNRQGMTPLHNAVMQGSLPLVEFLISQKADVTIKNNHLKTLLHTAAERGHIEIVDYLIKQKLIDLNEKNKNGDTALHKAAEQGHKKIVELLLKAGADCNIQNNDEKTPLHFAAQEGRFGITQLLVNQGANVNAKSTEYGTPLFLAMNGYPDVAEFLHKKGADLNAQVDKSGNSPLHKAVYGGYMELTQYLVNNKANLDVINKKGQTPLILAACEGEAELADYLIQQGAKLDVTGSRTQLLDLARDKDTHPQMANILLKATGNKIPLPSDVVLELMLIQLDKIRWKAPAGLFYSEPATVRDLKKIILETKQQTNKDPKNAPLLWDQSLQKVIKTLETSLQHKDKNVLGFFRRDPNTHKEYDSVLTILKMHVPHDNTLKEKQKP